MFLGGGWGYEAGAGPVEPKFTLERRTDGPYPLDEVDKLEASSLSKFAAYLAKHPSPSGCTLQNAVRRMEWSDLSETQRKSYIKAVLCLQSKPPKSPRDQFPGALNRFDDFVATHESMAVELHSTPHLLPAHRVYIWAYEKALREECGYTGYQPYWNWGRTAADPINSPLFNGNDSSMGGNGLPFNYPGVKTKGFSKPYDIIPSAGGGGMVVSLGPISKMLSDIPNNPRSDGFGSNPRCLRRDVNKFSAAVTTANYTYALITKNPKIEDFQQVMLGTPTKNDWGVHLGGHYTIGGDPGGDFYSSPGDPVFYMHHGMIDRIWWIWQMQDPENRMNVLPSNPAANDTVNLKWLTPTVNTWDTVNNIGGGCLFPVMIIYYTVSILPKFSLHLIFESSLHLKMSNGGIGFELASQLLSEPSKHVLLGSRSAEKGEIAIKDLESRELPGTVELLQLDVASDESISAAAKAVENKHGRYIHLLIIFLNLLNQALTSFFRLDILINNAAVSSAASTSSPAEAMALCFQTNSTGPFLVVEAFAPLLKKSNGTPRIINVSSAAGSIARRLDPTSQAHRMGMWEIAYCMSKTALNMLTVAQSILYSEQGFKVFAFSPGFVASNLSPHNKVENGAQPTEEGAAPIVKVVNGERDEEHGGFLSPTGQYPW
ncbi:hypothetical protein G7Y89_g594 [Cudoniella acicularis]|uniref:Tyrosinase copper-binding domain-containing protein n=1 Tax=Cudoniella acicularis TaxID=354080 RepID=A0A8H4RXW4_9HELO|nr:hypothetical protein G7Y89_g594 [Cudoniella acicularis]